MPACRFMENTSDQRDIGFCSCVYTTLIVFRRIDCAGKRSGTRCVFDRFGDGNRRTNSICEACYTGLDDLCENMALGVALTLFSFGHDDEDAV